MLQYRYVTDIADPVRQINFEFPETYWHNSEAVRDRVRDNKLESDGWKVVRVPSKAPTPEAIDTAIRKIMKDDS